MVYKIFSLFFLYFFIYFTPLKHCLPHLPKINFIISSVVRSIDLYLQTTRIVWWVINIRSLILFIYPILVVNVHKIYVLKRFLICNILINHHYFQGQCEEENYCFCLLYFLILLNFLILHIKNSHWMNNLRHFILLKIHLNFFYSLKKKF